jgi:SAM-dependent methyltransferase
MTVLTTAEIEQRLATEDLDAWLDLWAVEQGPAKRPSLNLMAAVVPAPAGGLTLRVLDLCCGPGDVGRAIHARFPQAEVDCVDRDIFLTQLCAAANRRAGVRGQVLVRNLYDADWQAGLAGPYDVVGVGTALHWLRPERAREVLADARQLLRPGGLLLFLEPVSAMAAIAPGYEAWQATQPPQHHRQDWLNFWTRVNDLLGYDHIGQLGMPDERRIGDRLSAADWLDLAAAAGFGPVDVLLRDAEKVIVAACKPAAPDGARGTRPAPL